MEKVQERNNTTTRWYKVKEGNLPPFRKEVRVVYLDNKSNKYVYFNNYLDIDIYSSENVGVENVDDLVKSWKFNPGWNYEIIAWTYLPEYDGNEDIYEVTFIHDYKGYGISNKETGDKNKFLIARFVRRDVGPNLYNSINIKSKKGLDYFESVEEAKEYIDNIKEEE